MKGLVNGSLGGERETGIDLSGDLSWDNVQDLLTKLNKELVEGGVNSGVKVLTLLLTVGDSGIDELGVLWLLGGSEDQRWVGGGILWLIFANGCTLSVCILLDVTFFRYGEGGKHTGKVTGVGDNGSASGLQLIERGRHGG